MPSKKQRRRTISEHNQHVARLELLNRFPARLANPDDWFRYANGDKSVKFIHYGQPGYDDARYEVKIITPSVHPIEEIMEQVFVNKRSPKP